MNNDIWSPREEPLERGKRYWFKTKNNCAVPKINQEFKFINNLLRKAWQMRVIRRKGYDLEFQAWPIIELEYEYALQNN